MSLKNNVTEKQKKPHNAWDPVRAKWLFGYLILSSAATTQEVGETVATYASRIAISFEADAYNFPILNILYIFFWILILDKLHNFFLLNVINVWGGPNYLL